MIGKATPVENKDKADRADSRYMRIVVFFNGGYKNLLLTDSDWSRVIERAEKNPEDCTQPSWWQKLLYWFIR
tara:strand:+ start:8656 stop:8871 length:216 start_codon:yes stop_codon:yes gene_type:complete